MKRFGVTVKLLIGLAIVAHFATAPPAVASAIPASFQEQGVEGYSTKPAHIESAAGQDASCPATDGKAPCMAVLEFPPLDMAASLFSLMAGCSRTGM